MVMKYIPSGNWETFIWLFSPLTQPVIRVWPIVLVMRYSFVAGRDAINRVSTKRTPLVGNQPLVIIDMEIPVEVGDGADGRPREIHLHRGQGLVRFGILHHAFSTSGLGR